ncbi:MAG: phenylacetate--CoA ligase, partial [archaeon]|nr:phenylacetate--CoA ligase [archaeon]
TGRADDMIKVKGVAVFPSQIEKALLKVGGVEPHYQIIVTRPGLMDEMEVKVEASPEIFSDAIKDMLAIQKKIGDYIQNEIGIAVKVTLVAPKSIPRTTKGKVQHVIDKRNLH